MSSTITPTGDGHAPIIRAGVGIAHERLKRYSRTVAMDLVGFCDVLTVVAGTYVTASIHDSFGDAPPNWLQMTQSGLIGGYIAYLWLRNAGYYDSKRMHELPASPLQLFAALAIAIAVVIGLGTPITKLNWHIVIWYSTWLTASYSLILLSRGIAQAVLARLTKAGRFDHHIAVFGAGSISRRVYDHLKGEPSGVHFVGVFDDRAGEARLNPEGLEVSGKLDDLLVAAYDGTIDDIIVALPQDAENRTAAIVRKLEQAPCNVHIVTHIASDLLPSRKLLNVSQIGEVGLLDVKERALSDWAPHVKRVEDIIVATLGLILATPVLVLAMIAIKLETAGPVIYRQRRRGLNRQVIEVLKLRTLKVAEADNEVRQVTAGDSRVTRVGRLLRRSSIDELPQLWNVLKGDMSIVGPRPHALVHDDQFGSMLEEYANRHQVKPGITGLAQVKGLRGETSTVDDIKDRVEHDIAYIRSWSLWLDLKIIAQTLVIMVSGRNAH